MSPPGSTGTVLLKKNAQKTPFQQPEWPALSPAGDTAHSPALWGFPQHSLPQFAGWPGTVTALAPHPHPFYLCPLQ